MHNKTIEVTVSETIFLDKDNVLSNYYYLDKMEVIVNTMSTLGYEALLTI